MTGDVENELRQAMREHVADVAAPGSLVHDVVRRHGRRVIRIRMLTAASVAAVALAALPLYNTVLPGQPHGPQQPGVGVAVSATPITSPPVPPTAYPGPSGDPRPLPPEPSGQGGDGPGTDRRSGLGKEAGILLGYLPAGLRHDGRCETHQFAGRQTSSCRWVGGGALNRSWVEVQVLREPGITTPDQFGLPAPRTEKTSIGGKAGIIGFRADGSRQVIWNDRRGVGVFVAVSADLTDDLAKIAGGVRVE